MQKNLEHAGKLEEANNAAAILGAKAPTTNAIFKLLNKDLPYMVNVETHFPIENTTFYY